MSQHLSRRRNLRHPSTGNWAAEACENSADCEECCAQMETDGASVASCEVGNGQRRSFRRRVARHPLSRRGRLARTGPTSAPSQMDGG